eukprot:307994_1
MGPDRKIDHTNPDIIIFAEVVGDFAGMSLIHNPRGAYRRNAGFSLMKGLPWSKVPKEERALIQMVDQKAREAKEAGSEGPSGESSTTDEPATGTDSDSHPSKRRRRHSADSENHRKRR